VHGDWSQVPTKTASTNRPPDSWLPPDPTIGVKT
jgi:hypothetical protein